MKRNPRYFTFRELTRTSTGLDNMPTWDKLDNIRAMAEFLDGIRSEFGSAITVNCCYRSKEVNAKVGGVASSAHLDGLAADICSARGTECSNRLLLALLESKIGEIDQLISYHKVAGDRYSQIRFIHVGIAANGKQPRGQRLVK